MQREDTIAERAGQGCHDGHVVLLHSDSAKMSIATEECDDIRVAARDDQSFDRMLERQALKWQGRLSTVSLL